MGVIKDLGNSAFRDWNTAGVPASGEHKPDKKDVRSLFSRVDAEISGLPAGLVWIDEGWASGTAFVRGNAVTHNGVSYRATANHTSAAGTEPGVGANWQTRWAALLEDTAGPEVVDARQGEPTLADNLVGMKADTAAEKVKREILEVSVGDQVTDEDVSAALLRDRDGYVTLGVDHEGRLVSRQFSNATDEDFEQRITDEDGIVIMGRRWGRKGFELGPFLAHQQPEVVFIENGIAKAIIGDKVVQVSSPDLTAIAAKLDGSDVLYWTRESGSIVTNRADLLAASSLAPGKVKVYHHIIYGQSLSNGVTSAPLLTSTALSSGNVVMFNGGIRTLGNAQGGGEVNTKLTDSRLASWVDAVEALDGSTGETPASGAAARALETMDSTDAILLSAHGIGGASYSQIKRGTAPYNNLLHAVRRAFLMCTLLDLDYEVVIHLVHGEADRAAALGVYKGYLVEMQGDLTTDINAIISGTGEVRLVISQMSAFTDYGMATSNVPQDQAEAAAENPGKIILAGSKYHLPTNDGTHLTNISSFALGDQHEGARARDEASEPSCLMALPWTRAGDTITMPCLVPVAPIVRDTATVTDPAGDVGAPTGIKYGLIYAQTGGTPVTISDVTASGSTLTITLSGDPGSPSAESIRIAMDGVAGADSGPTTGARSCFRDSSTGADTHGSPRFNWLAAGVIPKAS